MKQILRLVCIAVLACACSKPLPSTSELSVSFDQKREQIDTLEKMLDESNYEIVDLRGEKVTGHWFEGTPYPGQVAEQERPADADRWADLMREVHVMSVERWENGELWLPIDYEVLEREFQGNVFYVSSETIHNEVRQCEKKFSRVRCGNCIVGLEDDWWLVYKWAPGDIADAVFDDWQEGRITEEEAYEAQSEIIDECILEGGTLVDKDASQ